MRLSLILALVLFAFPATAGEKTPLSEYLDSMPPLPSDVRASFDKAARDAYDPKCTCIRFIIKGDVIGFKLPLNDGDRRLLIKMLMENWAVPFSPKGQAS